MQAVTATYEITADDPAARALAVALVGEPERALLATALKPVGMTSGQLADLASAVAAGGLHVIKEDQGLANRPWAPFRERVPRVAEAVRRVNASSAYLPVVDGSPDQIRFARDSGAHGVVVLPGVAGFRAPALAADLFAGGMVLAHPSFLGGFTASPTHGIAPDVLFGTLLRLAGADARSSRAGAAGSASPGRSAWRSPTRPAVPCTRWHRSYRRRAAGCRWPAHPNCWPPTVPTRCSSSAPTSTATATPDAAERLAEATRRPG